MKKFNIKHLTNVLMTGAIGGIGFISGVQYSKSEQRKIEEQKEKTKDLERKK